ncbi:MAG: ACT domain-containing protein [Candidatus Omnitrophica bacterium]|nr:ACT domain-containing protein [Candidatus Omnitrophota bacterium]MCM8790333.1 ACT domain-containing protein [Candidatus Omnitrophota bacterium]
MIKGASLGKEIVVTTENKIGVLANISKILADHGINIEGVAGYAANNEAKIMIVAADTLRAKEAIQKAGYKNTKENEVVIVDLENKAGALKSITAMMAAEKIDIRYIYGTTCPAGCPARIIISTTANEKAVVLFKSK